MIYAISVLVLAAIFTVATVTPVNMGILAFAAAFIVGAWVSDIPIEDVVDAFPAGTFHIVGGITLLFAIAKANGTLDYIMDRCLHLVRGRHWAIVWMLFALSGLLMSMGAVLAVGMLAPIAMPLAARNRINPFLMGMMITHGGLACVFSPINLYGALVTGIMKSVGLPTNPGVIFLVPFVLNLAIGVVLFLVFGRDLIRGDDVTASDGPIGGIEAGRLSSPASDGSGVSTAVLSRSTTGTVVETAPARPRLDRYQGTTLVGILFLAVGSVGFGIDIGVSSICVSAALLLMAPKSHPKIVDNVAWPAVVLVCGMLTYMAVLTQNGTLDFLGNTVSDAVAPLFTALILCYAVGILSAFASSTATIGIALPLAMPLLLGGEVGVLGFVAAIVFSATVVDVSPFSLHGVMILANAEVEDKIRFQRKMLAYCGVVVLFAPLIVWALVVVPTSV
ncbi:SLC13 family permease [Rhodococcus sp. JS3073]|uniref:SLC13 family permease n=1 Tax=Rhodococcus sp. JS3073 TaxID=3002901 RepID=UPI00228609B5|nr:SLC13 family permease [Rhodococcus sp. JS3073]WAM12333.1 SLC13 family permease [Rhodococcus sp. JS3073]